MATPGKQFLEAIRQGRLMLPFDNAAGSFMALHEMDRADENRIQWKAASGQGIMVALAIYHRRYTAEVDPPYNVAMVRLKEGPVILSTVLGDAEYLSVGMSVTAVFQDGNRLAFEPEGDGAGPAHTTDEEDARP
tara:strand:- start:9822 stop:10223 length:402 start_codon:yes stop_codon:yes gene_type:complete